jgi:hypothetical protein
MQNIDDTCSERMGNLNNAMVAVINTTDCDTLEVISVLRLIARRLESAFELQVMGNPVQRIADDIKEKDTVALDKSKEG